MTIAVDLGRKANKQTNKQRNWMQVLMCTKYYEFHLASRVASEWGLFGH